jgi:hypothetical protein
MQGLPSLLNTLKGEVLYIGLYPEITELATNETLSIEVA